MATSDLLLLAAAAAAAWLLLGDGELPTAVPSQPDTSSGPTQSEIEDLRQLNADDYAGEGFQPGTRAYLNETSDDDYQLGDGGVGL